MKKRGKEEFSSTQAQENPKVNLDDDDNNSLPDYNYADGTFDMARIFKLFYDKHK